MALASPNLYKTLRRADLPTIKLQFKRGLLSLNTLNVAGPNDLHPYFITSFKAFMGEMKVSAILVRVVKYWNKLPTSVLPIGQPPPNCIPPINIHQLYMYPNSLF